MNLGVHAWQVCYSPQIVFPLGHLVGLFGLARVSEYGSHKCFENYQQAKFTKNIFFKIIFSINQKYKFLNNLPLFYLWAYLIMTKHFESKGLKKRWGDIFEKYDRE